MGILLELMRKLHSFEKQQNCLPNFTSSKKKGGKRAIVWKSESATINSMLILPFLVVYPKEVTMKHDNRACVNN